MKTRSLKNFLVAGTATALIAGAAAFVYQPLATAQDNAAAPAANIVRDPTEVPAPITARAPQHHVINLETVELEGQLADGSTYTYWTFNHQVPGPMIRVRVLAPKR